MKKTRFVQKDHYKFYNFDKKLNPARTGLLKQRGYIVSFCVYIILLAGLSFVFALEANAVILSNLSTCKSACFSSVDLE